MPDKSYVTLEQHICSICGKRFDTNAILMHKRMREVFEPKTVTGYGFCPDDQKKVNDGFFALVAADPLKSTASPDGTLKPENAHRTGEICWIRREAYERLFDIPLDEKQPWAFCDPEVILKLRSMIED